MRDSVAAPVVRVELGARRVRRPCASRAGNDCGNAILDAHYPNNAYVESLICDSNQHREPYVGPTRNDGWVCGQH
jgi:hypothetical protein